MNGTKGTIKIPVSIQEKLSEAVREIGLSYEGEAGQYIAFRVPGLDRKSSSEKEAIAKDVMATLSAIADQDVVDFMQTKEGIHLD